MDKPKDPELRDCVVRFRDDHEVEHCVRLRATWSGKTAKNRMGEQRLSSKNGRRRNLRRADHAYGQRQEAAGLVETAGKITLRRVQERKTPSACEMTNSTE